MHRRATLIVSLLGLLALVLTHLAAYAFGWQAHARDETARAAHARQALINLEERYRKQGERHVETVDQLKTQLSDAQQQLAQLTTGRYCLSAAAVRVLNRTGRVPAPTAASAEAPGTPERLEDDRAGEPFATDHDAAVALAECRTQYGVVSDQLNKIIDIELERTRSD